MEKEAWNKNVYMWSIRRSHHSIQHYYSHRHYNNPFSDCKAFECSERTLDRRPRQNPSSPAPTASPRSWRANRFYSPLLWLVLIVLLLAWIPSYAAAQRPPGFNLYQCRRAFDTSAQISYICNTHPDLFPILKYAEVVAREECERTFKDEEWNCTGFSLLKAPNITRLANKEAGYVRALSLAAIAHTVAKACKEHGENLHSCSCEDDLDIQVSQEPGDIVMPGCSDNMEFGLRFAETFLNKSFHGIGNKEKLDFHNIQAGRLLFQDIITDTPAHCHCHGYSGACTFRTCWSDLPEFQEIGKKLKDFYDEDSCRVESNRLTGENHGWIPQETCVGFTERTLLYNKDTPNHCLANPEYGIPGVAGRICDPNGSGPNSCENLCVSCGLIHPSHMVTVTKQCSCTFHFCCDIICDTCEQTDTYHTCSAHFHESTLDNGQ